MPSDECLSQSAQQTRKSEHFYTLFISFILFTEAANNPHSHNPQSTIHNPQSTIHNPQSTIHNPQSTIHTHTIIKKVNKYISINNHRAFSNSMKCRLLCLKTPNENKVDLGCVIRRLSPCILMTLSGSDMLPVVPVGFCRLAIEGTH